MAEVKISTKAKNRTRSAKKALRVSERKRVFNTRRKKTMKDLVKQEKQLIDAKSASEAAALLPKVFQAIDKSARQHVIHPKAAARMKSRFAKRIAALA